MSSSPAPPRHSPVALIAAIVLLIGAGAVHFAVVPEHLHEHLLFGAIFLVAGMTQVVAAVAVAVRPRRAVLAGTAAGSAALVLLWLVSRTVGLPVGPQVWTAEAIGIPDVTCVLLEVAAAVVLAGLAWRGPRPRRRRPVRTTLAAAPVVLLAALVSFVGVGTGSSAMVMAHNEAPPHGAGGTSVTTLQAAPGDEPVDAITLTAKEAVIDGHPRLTYDGTVPGPELRVTQGHRVRVTLVNELPVATTLHWHGIRVPNAADGVAGMTQDAVAPGARYTYEFLAADAGTFWYHSHQDTGNQIPAGLFGSLIVVPAPGRVAEDVDQTVLLHDGPADSGAIAVNGKTGDLPVDARPGQTVRLRVIDAVAPGMDGAAEAPVLLGAPYRVVALDGHDLTAPTSLGPQRLRLGMGQRADIVFTMPASGAVRLVDSRIAGSPSPLQSFFGNPSRAGETVTIGTGATPAAVDPAAVPVFDPLTYGSAAPDPTTGPADVTAPVVLGEGPGFRDGGIQLVHSINGAAAPDVAPVVVRPGQLVQLHIVNDTGEFHPMHLHGHLMTVLGTRGSPLHLDTVLLAPHETMDVTFRSDNPGLWTLHCHVLLHATMGMSMSIIYAGVTTPFEMGHHSGNIPE